jgi:putative oxidoreductase
MNTSLNKRSAILPNAVLLAGRLLLAGIFLHEGVYLVVNFAVASASMAKTGVPPLALIATIALQLAAGIAIAAGWHARLGAAALGLFCLATAILFHTNFANRNELLHFEKDIAIAGGMFILMVRGAGRYSIDAYVGQETPPGDIWQRFVRTFEAAGKTGGRSAPSKQQANPTADPA